MGGRLKSNFLSRLPAGRHCDGRNLYLHVRDTGRAAWEFRSRRHGKTIERGLGSFPDVSLVEAREKAASMRQNLAAGRQVKTGATTTFAEVARAYIIRQSPSWRSRKHTAQWSSTLETYAFPIIGSMPVCQINTGHILTILAPIWNTRNETASRIRGRIENILDSAKVLGLRPDGTNPAAWRGNLDKLLPPRNRTRTVRHHTALAFEQTKELYRRLTTPVPGEAARALRFLILTAARTGEIIGARWSEIDTATSVWTIPAERMKVGRLHRVPLSAEALEILGGKTTGYLFGHGD
ncbi:MAG: integrase arm-type DNA-binding domain-containing protein, partial [Methylocella sp.]